jgi:hypothetical protein
VQGPNQAPQGPRGGAGLQTCRGPKPPSCRCHSGPSVSFSFLVSSLWEVVAARIPHAMRPPSLPWTMTVLPGSQVVSW